jgi:hypothetical protein
MRESRAVMWFGITVGGGMGLLVGFVVGYRLGKREAVVSIMEIRDWAQEAVEVTKRMLAAQPCAVCGVRRIGDDVDGTGEGESWRL